MLSYPGCLVMAVHRLELALTSMFSQIDVIMWYNISAYSETSGRFVMVSKKNNPLFLCGWDKKTSLWNTVCHHSASVVMPSGHPRNECFYPTRTLKMDSYSPSRGIIVLHPEAQGLLSNAKPWKLGTDFSRNPQKNDDFFFLLCFQLCTFNLK